MISELERSRWSRIGSHRPQFLHLGLFIAAYVLAAGFAQLLAIVPGTGVSIWPPSGLFIATLVVASPLGWPWWVLAGLLAELSSNVLWFHNPLPVAVLIYTGNALEAMLGAWLVNRICGRPVQLETLHEVIVLVVMGAVIAPLVSATVGSATLAWFGMQSFTRAWPLFWIGDATGVLIVAPLALVLFQNWRRDTRGSAAPRWVEACAVGLIFLGVAAFSLSGYLPFAYLIMPPLLWAAVRFEFKGAVIALTLLALITAAFTITGVGQFAGDPESQHQKQIMLQLFLAISAFSALVVAAISRQHHTALLTLRESERGRSQLIDMVPIHLWRLAPNGEPVFFNRRMVDYLGMDVADTEKPGMSRLDALIDTVHPDDAAAFGNTLRNCVVTGDSFALRCRLRRADGVYRWMSSRAEPMRNDDGRIVQWYGLCHDIDDQMHAEEALRRSERQLQQMIDTVPAMIWCTTPDGIPCYLNKRTTDITGITLKDMVAPDRARSLAIVHPDERDAVDRMFARAIATGTSFMARYRQRRADGCHRWIEGRAEPLHDDTGKIVQWYGVSVDIDDMVTAQEALRDREREFSQIVNMVPVHIRRLTPEGEPTFFNKRLLDFSGLESLENLDKPGMSRLEAAIRTLVHPDDAGAMSRTVYHSITTGEPHSMKYRMRRADGEYRWVEGRAEPLRDENGAIVHWYVISIDIEDEMCAQTALREREQELSQLVDMVPSLLWRLDPDGRPNFFNKRITDFFGPGVLDLDNPEMSRLPAIIEAVAHPDDVASLKEALNHCLVTGEHFSMKYRMRYADGVYRWVDGRAEPLRDQSGRITQWYGLSHDIDDQVRAQEALRQSEQLYRALFHYTPIPLWRVNTSQLDSLLNQVRSQGVTNLGQYMDEHPDFLKEAMDRTVIEEVNRSAVELFGARHDTDLTGPITPYWQAPSDRVRRSFEARFRGEQSHAEHAKFTTCDGRVLEGLHTAVFPSALANLGISIGSFVDATDRIKAQEDLRMAHENMARASQAASLAELSASIAHEVGQPLAALISSSDACQRWLTANPPNMERAQIALERIMRSANSATNVVSRIRALFKQSVETRNLTDLDRVIVEARNLLAEEASRRRVHTLVEVESGLPLVAVDRVQIQQVLINLMRNGMEAMDTTTDERVLRVRVRRMEDAIQTEISDRGPGVEFPERIFQPFFTTKEQGMGMGLAICRSIVESHGGRLWAENNEPVGATFIFTLPVDVNMAP
ncbi:PAS domain-containing protein [Pararhizobium sp. BT-229]|uniref:PAS domain-containing protein n=1 Tax=Pararhizobium sp. BT-229 TaxID=2986923 RepID=UPI0021F6D1A4|nr:PAS domain-containing protein [Pararhizobium sp. BT-229]MCV9966723.1 PAS domain-containing protein [Pararhizobium sp. BT-229]